MPPAARVGDVTAHPGSIVGPGVSTVRIGGMPAAVLGDSHACAFTPPPGSHGTTVIAKGSATVTIGKKPAARVGDTAACGASIMSGAFDVLIGG